MSPGLIAIQQGPQIIDALAQMGLGVGTFITLGSVIAGLSIDVIYIIKAFKEMREAQEDARKSMEAVIDLDRKSGIWNLNRIEKFGSSDIYEGSGDRSRLQRYLNRLIDERMTMTPGSQMYKINTEMQDRVNRVILEIADGISRKLFLKTFAEKQLTPETKKFIDQKNREANLEKYISAGGSLSMAIAQRDSLIKEGTTPGKSVNEIAYRANSLRVADSMANLIEDLKNREQKAANSQQNRNAFLREVGNIWKIKEVKEDFGAAKNAFMREMRNIWEMPKRILKIPEIRSDRTMYGGVIGGSAMVQESKATSRNTSDTVKELRTLNARLSLGYQ